jgi:tetratricopeptide (TPR) repeat protein
MSKNSPVPVQDWLEQAFPQVHCLLLALDGQARASHWLAENSQGMSLFSRALAGEKNALQYMETRVDELDDLFEVVDNEDLTGWLAQRRPDLHLLFNAIRGDDIAAVEIKKRKPALAKMLSSLRTGYKNFRQRSNDLQPLLENTTVADMGCLIGEMHLRQGEYEKAVEAFSRAIETRPAADLYEGRARAYRLLAERDESAATLLRQHD